MKKKLLRYASEKKQVHFSLGLLAAYVLFCVIAVGFVKLAWEVRERETTGFDESVLTWINKGSTHFLDKFMPVATDIGGLVGVVALTLIIVALFVYKNESRRALLVVTSVAGAALLNIILKSIFTRDRPELWTRLIQETGYSFPSGHAMASAALAIAVAVALWHSRWRWYGFWFAVIYMVFVGYSRLYLGVHYPTDIVAGWLVSGAWVLAVALLMRSKFGHQALRGLK